VRDARDERDKRDGPDGGLIDLPLRATFSPALPFDCFAIDFPGRASIPCEALPILPTPSKGAAKAVLDCAHRTSTIINDPSKLACISLHRAAWSILDCA